MTTSFKIVNESEETYSDGSPNKEVILVQQYDKPNIIIRQIVLSPKQESETLYVWEGTTFTIEEVKRDDLI